MSPRSIVGLNKPNRGNNTDATSSSRVQVKWYVACSEVPADSSALMTDGWGSSCSVLRLAVDQSALHSYTCKSVRRRLPSNNSLIRASSLELALCVTMSPPCSKSNDTFTSHRIIQTTITEVIPLTDSHIKSSAHATPTCSILRCW